VRDIRKGIAAKRLNVADPLLSFVAVAGTSLGAISVGLQLGFAQGQQSATLKELGSNLERLPERTATMALEALGLSRSEAEKIAYRPLPAVDLPLAGNGLGAGQLSSKMHNGKSEPRGIQRAIKRGARE